MNERRIAARLLTVVASGGTLEGIVTAMPAFKEQIETALEWMRSQARCSRVEVETRARRLGKLIRRKEQAIRDLDFDLAVEIRGKERAMANAFGLKAKGQDWNTILDLDYQMQELSALLRTLPAG